MGFFLMADIDSPPLKIFEHSREGYRTFEGPPSYEQDKGGVTVEGKVDSVHYSDDGELVALYSGDTLSIYRTTDGSLVSSIVHAKIKMICFSPGNSIIQTWQYFEKLANPTDVHPDNLILWDVETGERIFSWLEKRVSASNWPFVKFTADESISAKMSNGKVNFYAGKHFNVIIRVFKLPGITHFSWAPGTDLPHKFAVFLPEKKGQPGRIKVCEYPDTNKVVLQKSIFKAQNAEILWNKQGTAALLICQTDVDTSGKSYYGETGVHLLTLNPVDCKNVRPSLDKQGPIYECVWSPTGDKFVAVYGSMPSKTTLFNLKLERLMDFPIAHRNTAIFCPHGHTLVIAGFGNLQGQMDLWDVKRGRLICAMKAPCTTECKWSPCSSYLMTSTLTPRLRQDNGWKIWTPTGELLKETAVEELYHTSWRPISATRYPNRPPKKELSEPKPEVAKAAAPAAYRPPHARNKPVEAKAPEPVVAQKFVPKSQQAKTATPLGELSKSAQKNKKRRQKKKQQQQQQQPSAADNEPKKEEASNESNTADNEKRVKALNKKLRQIDQLKNKEKEGKELNEQERAKVAAEAELRAELASINK